MKLKIPKNTDITPLIVTLVKLYRPHTYMELGTKRGYTFNQVAPLVQRAVAIDPAGFDHIKYLSHVEKYRVTSNEMASLWCSPIDMIFIDACHQVHQVLLDVKHFLPHLRTGTGLMLLHDTYPVYPELEAPGYCHDAWRAAHHIRQYYSGRVEIVTLPGPWFGLSIIRKIPADKHFNDER